MTTQSPALTETDGRALAKANMIAELKKRGMEPVRPKPVEQSDADLDIRASHIAALRPPEQKERPMISPSDITAATAGPVDIATLERAFLAFVAYPDGEALTGFDGSDHMLSSFLDGVAVHLVGDFNSVPDDAYDVLRAYAMAHGAPLLSPSFRDAAAMVTITWHGFAERFAAGFAAAA